MHVRKILQNVGRVVGALFTVFIIIPFAGCSGTASTTTTTTTSALTTLDGLPNATSPVVDATSGSLSALTTKAAATVGMILGTTTESSFTSSSSLAACEMFNQTKRNIASAIEGDLIQCYVAEIATANTISGVDIYDGDYHIFGLADSAGEAPDHVKFKVVKDSSGNITQFEMFACRSGSQEFYLNQTISNNTFTMSEKSIESGHGSHEFSVTGTVNSDGNFTGTKVLTESFSGGSSGNNFWGSSTLEQTTDNISLTGYNAGSFTDSQSSCTGSYSNIVAAEAQLLDGNASTENYDIALLALGDGAVKGSFSGTSNCSGDSGTWSDSGTEGWNGDTRVVDSTAAASYITAVSSATLPSASSSAPSIAFSGSEIYNCLGTEIAELAVNQQNLNTACESLNESHSWIDCWNATGGL